MLVGHLEVVQGPLVGLGPDLGHGVEHKPIPHGIGEGAAVVVQAQQGRQHLSHGDTQAGRLTPRGRGDQLGQHPHLQKQKPAAVEQFRRLGRVIHLLLEHPTRLHQPLENQGGLFHGLVEPPGVDPAPAGLVIDIILPEHEGRRLVPADSNDRGGWGQGVVRVVGGLLCQ